MPPCGKCKAIVYLLCIVTWSFCNKQRVWLWLLYQHTRSCLNTLVFCSHCLMQLKNCSVFKKSFQENMIKNSKRYFYLGNDFGAPKSNNHTPIVVFWCLDGHVIWSVVIKKWSAGLDCQFQRRQLFYSLCIVDSLGSLLTHSYCRGGRIERLIQKFKLIKHFAPVSDRAVRVPINLNFLFFRGQALQCEPLTRIKVSS